MSLIDFAFRQLKYARRYNKILRVLVRYGFEDYVAQLKRRKGFSFVRMFMSRKRLSKASEMTKWERMRLVCEELGPTFVKFGQILSNRRDLIPEELVVELMKLQDNVPPFPGSKARSILEREFGDLSNSKVAEFDELPFASASMAQVHKATLKTGEKVVMKIQRPGIRDVIEEDIQIMREIVSLLSERMPSIRHFDPMGLVEQFSESVHYELDFIHESINLKRFDYYFEKNDVIHAPKVYNELTSTKIITLQMIEGVKPLRVNSLAEFGIDNKWIARQIIESFFKQVFEYGFFHADPHAGNIIVTADRKIYFIDFGMMGTILKKDMEYLGNLILAIQSQDVSMMMNAIMYLTNVISFENRRKLEYDLVEFINKFAFTGDFHLRISQMLVELTDIINQHNLQVPSHFFLLTRAMFSVEGLVRDLDSDLVLMDEVRPVITRRITEDRNPIKTGEKILNSLYDLGNYMEEFPSDLRQTMKMFRGGKMKMSLQHEGMDPFIHTINRMGRQIVAAIIVAAFLLGSSVFIIAETEPQWKGVPVYSVFGLIAAGVVGVYLWLQILKKEKEFKSEQK